MNALPPPSVRVAHLSNYLRDLINDIAAQGKIAKITGDPIQVAAVALLSGSIAVVETMWKDITFLAGNAKTHAKVAARPVVEQIATRGASFLLNKFLGSK